MTQREHQVRCPDCRTGRCGARYTRCRSCARRAAWKSGAFAHRQPTRRYNQWSAGEIQRLRELAGTIPKVELAARLTAEFGAPRTQLSIEVRASREGISLWEYGNSPWELAAIFGHSSDAIISAWVKPGWLKAQRSWSLNQWGRAYRITDADVVAFLRDCPWAYDVSRMRKGHRYAQLAEVYQRADPWLATAEVAAVLNCKRSTIYRYFDLGLIGWRHRLAVGRVVHAADVAALRDAVNDIRARGWENRRINIRRAIAARAAERKAA